MGALSMMVSEPSQATSQEEPRQRRKSSNPFEMPQDYSAGRLPRLRTHAREWWLNIDYVESEAEPDDEVIRLLIRHNRRARNGER